ncbi:unnamed protein product, partial [Urochloa humidicola]
VEDIVDTGNTLSCLIAHLKKKGTSSISVCTFLDKPARRKVNVQLVGNGKFYSGFKVLSNTMKQKRKEKAGKWVVPLPKPQCENWLLHSDP